MSTDIPDLGRQSSASGAGRRSAGASTGLGSDSSESKAPGCRAAHCAEKCWRVQLSGHDQECNSIFRFRVHNLSMSANT